MSIVSNNQARSRPRQEHVCLPSNLTRVDVGFFDGSTVDVARRLIGAYLVRRIPEPEPNAGTVVAGRIVETEAYLPLVDPACHGYRGPTRRNAVMFGRPGRAYVYFIYGNHYCLNVTTERPGIGAAVLVRALEPTAGIDVMLRRRGPDVPEPALACGPGNLCRAFAIDRRDDGADLTSEAMFIARPTRERELAIVATPRIGLTVARTWALRFFDPDSPSVSPFRKKPARRH